MHDHLSLHVAARPINHEHAAQILEHIAAEIRRMEKDGKPMPHWQVVNGSVTFDWRLE